MEFGSCLILKNFAPTFEIYYTVLHKTKELIPAN